MSEAHGGSPDVILMGTGSELQCAMQAQELLEEKDIAARVVSMPSWEIFQNQPKTYRQQVLPDEVRARISIEAAATFGWEKWVGEKGISIGIDQFGASAPYKDLFNSFDLTAEIMVDKAEKLVKEIKR
jgi:transketolase